MKREGCGFIEACIMMINIGGRCGGNGPELDKGDKILKVMALVFIGIIFGK